MITIIWSKVNIASDNICKYLIEKHGFIHEGNVWVKDNIQIVPVNENVIDFEYFEQCDYVIVPSTHKSESSGKSLTVHVPGNWFSNDLGGQEKTLNKCYPSKMKTILNLIKHKAEGLDWNITLEVDHHGPTINNPIMFVEIGSTEKEWNDPKAIQIIAESIIEGIEKNETFIPALGFGGSHYASKFNKFEFDSEYALGHIMPKYQADNLNDEMFKQALTKTIEPFQKVLIDWKGLKSEQRNKVIEFCELNNIEWVRV